MPGRHATLATAATGTFAAATQATFASSRRSARICDCTLPEPVIHDGTGGSLFGYWVLGLGAGLEVALGVEVGGTLPLGVADGPAFTSALADGTADAANGDTTAEGAPDGLAAPGTLAAGRPAGGTDPVADVARLPDPPAQAATANAMAAIDGPIRLRVTSIRVHLPQAERDLDRLRVQGRHGTHAVDRVIRRREWCSARGRRRRPRSARLPQQPAMPARNRPPRAGRSAQPIGTHGSYRSIVARIGSATNNPPLRRCTMSIRRSVVPMPLTLAIAAALAVAACGGSAPASQAPGSAAPSTAPAASVAASAAAQPSVDVSPPAAEASQPPAGDTGGLDGAAARLSSIGSYKFKMTLSGGSFGTLLGAEPITGTVTTNPKAARMSMMGIEMIEANGKTWIKMGSDWTESTDDSTSSLADSFAPEKMFGSTLSGSAAQGYKAAGEEQKNGVTAVHYTADASQLGEYGSLFGVEGATWSADVWVAKEGGYPVSMSVQANGGSEKFQMSFDITDINNPSNKVELPV